MLADARAHARAAGLLAALLLGLYWRPLLLPYALVPADLVFATPFFAGAAPPGFTRPANELLFDQVYQFVPWRHFAHEQLRRGALPLWNPHSLSGTPFVATLGSAVFYPLNLALTALPFARTFVWSAVVRLWVAGFSTYLLGRAYGLGAASALVAGIAFMLCGYLTVWLGHPHTNVAVLLPLLLLADERLLAAVGRRGRRRAVALLALGVGVQFTGGHAESSAHVLLCLAAYHALRWWQLGRGPGLVGPPGAAIVLGAGLAAVQLLPFLEWLPLSAELARRSAAPLRLLDPAAWHRLATLPLLVFPNLYNNPTWGSPYRSFLPWGNYNENVLWVGVVTLALAAVGTATRWRTAAAVRAWAWLALVAAAMTSRLPVVDWLNALPGLALCKPERLRLVVSLALCLLAGFGLEAVRDDRAGARRGLAQALGAVALAGLALALAGTLVLPRLRAEIVAHAQQLAEAKFAALRAPSRPLAAYQTEAARLVDALLAAVRPTNLALYAPALVALAGLATLRRARRPQMLLASLAALVAADAVAAGWGYNPSMPIRDLYPRTRIAARLAADPMPHRMTALREDLVPDAHLMLGLSDVRGLDFPTRWYDTYLSLVPERLPWISYGVLLAAANSPLLRVLDLKYVVTARPDELLRSPGVRLVASDGAVHLGEIASPVPRGFLVHEAAVARDDAEAARLLASDPEAVVRRVVLAAADGVPPPAPDPIADPAAAITPEHHEPRRTVWRVRTARAGYLVTTDAYYPGWQADLDGRRVGLWRANLAFRAVHVPPGEHVVTFRYRPRSVGIGLVIGAVSACVVAAMLLAGTGKGPRLGDRR